MEQWIKTVWPLAVGAASGFLMPLLPYAFLCTALVVWDAVSAVRLGRKLGRKVCSRGLWRMVCTVAKVNMALVLAYVAQRYVVDGFLGFDALKFTCGAICAVQVLSILENESSRTGARWARVLRRFLVDKSKRHLEKMSDF